MAKDSHNSSKPPSSDGPRRKPRSQRHQSEKPPGGQPGHAGCTLMQVANPDEVLRHRPLVCAHCQQPLEGVAGQLKERRQVHDLPEVRLLVREHQVEEVCCPASVSSQLKNGRIFVRYFWRDDGARRGCASLANTMSGRCNSPWPSNTRYGYPCDASGRAQQTYEDILHDLFFFQFPLWYAGESTYTSSG